MVGARLAAGLLALVWLVPGFGLIDLTVTWDPGWPVVLEAGWGMFVTTGIALPLLVAAVRPATAAAALLLLLLSTGVLLVAAVLSLEPETAWMFLLLAISAAPLWRLHRTVAARDLRPPRLVGPAGSARVPLLALAALAGPFGLAYAWQMADLNRQQLPGADVTNGVDHYAVQAATGLFVVVLVLVAGRWAGPRRQLGTSAGLTAAYLGLVSFSFPGTEGGVGRGLSSAAMGWGAAVLVATWWPAPAAPERSPGTA